MSSNNQNASNKSKRRYSILAVALTALITIIASGLITYLMLEIKFNDPINITINDWIKVVVPILGSSIVVIFAFLGVDRLKNFDERQDKLSKELKDELSDKVNNATAILEPKFEKVLKEKADTIIASLSSYEGKLASINETIKYYEEKMGSLDQIRTITDAIGNIKEAQEYIEKQFLIDMSNNSLQWQERTRSLTELVKRVVSGEIRGNSADYHNMATELARNSYYDLACEVIEKGIHFFPYDIDLLADVLRYIYTFENAPEMAEKSISTLESIGRDGWNWRAFTFYIDYINGLNPSEENKNKVFKLISDYKAILPNEERAYMAEYETYSKYGEIEKAENALLYAESNIDMTAQCSLALSKIYRRKGEYDKAVYSAMRAIQSQAEDQPSSDTGAAFASRAFALDAKIIRQKFDGNVPEQSAIRAAIEDYKMAQQFGYMVSNTKKRVEILKGLLPPEEKAENDLDEISERVEALEKLVHVLFTAIEQDNA